MEDLLQQFQTFSTSTKPEKLRSWLNIFDQEIGNISDNEKGYYYLLSSQLNAIYLRNIEQARNILKKIRNPSFILLQEIKLRRCFYKYLQGDYESASQTLQQIIQTSSSSCAHKIAKDFFSRIYAKENYSSFGKNQKKVNRNQSYQMDYLKAIKQQRQGKTKMACEIHKEIVQNYGDLDSAIEYQSAKHIQLLVAKDRMKPNRQEMQKYLKIVAQYQKDLGNKKYYAQKVEYLLKVLDLIESQSEGEEQTKKYQLAKQFLMDKLKKAIASQKDREVVQRLKSVLNALKDPKSSGEEICYKFLGDKQLSQISQILDPKKQSKMVYQQSKMTKMQDVEEKDEEQAYSTIKKTSGKVQFIQFQHEPEEVRQSKFKKIPSENINQKSKINNKPSNSKMTKNKQQEQEQQNMKSYNKKSQQQNQKISFSDDYEDYNLKSKSKLVPPSAPRELKQTESKLFARLQLDPDFEGSYMTKINFNSGGHDQRYFYMKQDFQETMKLYFCSKKQKKSSSDEFYRLKGFKKMTTGKKSDALKRKQCQDFQPELCFTLYISTAEEDYQRNFYVKEKEDYSQWTNVFKYLLSKKDTLDNMKSKTRIFVK